MLIGQKVNQERLDELRAVLGKIPGARRQDWILEVYEQRDGKDYLAQVIDIKTGQIREREKREREPA